MLKVIILTITAISNIGNYILIMGFISIGVFLKTMDKNCPHLFTVNKRLFGVKS